MTIVPKGYNEDPETGITYPILIMDKEEIMEREQLNVENTSGKLRTRVLKHLATTNGHAATSIQ